MTEEKPEPQENIYPPYADSPTRRENPGAKPIPQEPGKLTVAEALAWLDTQTFATKGDSTEIVREMRDAC